MNKSKFHDLIEGLSAQHGNQPFVVDGIVNDEQFQKTSSKILWILKEMNYPDPEDEWLDMTGILNEFAEKNEIASGWKHTFDKLVYATYGILDGFKLYDETPNRYTTPEMNKVLAQIAYINVNKFMGAGPVTDMNSLSDWFQKNKALLYTQIDQINPDIIIG